MSSQPSFYRNVRPMLRGIVHSIPRFGDIRDRTAVEVLAVYYWVHGPAGVDKLVWQGTNLSESGGSGEFDPFGNEIPLPYEALNARRMVRLLTRKAPDAPLTFDSEDLMYVDSVRFLLPIVKRNRQGFVREELVIRKGFVEESAAGNGSGSSSSPSSGSSSPTEAEDVLGSQSVQLLRAFAQFEVPNVPGGEADPFDYAFEDGKQVIYTVTAANGTWTGATNVIVRYQKGVAEREVVIVRGV
jgi:hypothetical protein